MSNEVELTKAQMEAIHETDRHLQIVACAGSGKTEVIARRIAHILQSKPEIAPEQIVAFTFTEKAAASLRSRIEKAIAAETNTSDGGMQISTIHAFCHRLLTQYTDRFQGFRVLDTVKSHHFVERYKEECGMTALGLEPNPRNIRLFLQCVDKMIDDYEHAEEWTQVQRDVLSQYIECLYQHGFIDFSLMIFEALKQIDSTETVKSMLAQIKYLVVDEYQDVNNLQEKLINKIAEAGANICVVGDDDQTIYQFRGSNAEHMISFADRYPNVHQVRLETNFRCAPGIINVANSVIKNNKRRLFKEMCAPNREPTSDSEIAALRYSDKVAQFDAIAQKAYALHRAGTQYRDMAILVRKGKTIIPVTQALSRAGIPFETDSTEQFFTGEYFNRFLAVLQCLSAADKAKLFESWNDIIDNDGFKQGFRFLRSCARGCNLPFHEIVRGFCSRVSFLNDSADDVENRRFAVDGICKILSDFDEIYGDWQLSARIEKITRFIGTQAAEEYRYHSFMPTDPNEDCVHIMTVHKAKGLEFDSVFLPELMKREFPVANIGGKKYWSVLGGVFEEKKDRYQSDLEDERKLFYVAVTRAKRNLFMTYELSTQPISCFVKEAASSMVLKINRNDLLYCPEKKTPEKRQTIVNQEGQLQEEAYVEEEERRGKEYWEAVKYARSQLYEYYGTACHFFPAAHADLLRIKSMTPEEILREASYVGLI